MEYVYAALLLHKLGKPVDTEGITKVAQAAGATVDDAKIKSLVASLNGVDIDAELANAVVAAAPAAGGEASAKEEKKEAPKEEKAEASAAGLSALFG
ncbi:50S ribosomal protein P1 [Candidatus Pacearchaeota archaeon]|nr:50S ribosomal protein P1 [Candidatus Pacearchaeota archaeon]